MHGSSLGISLVVGSPVAVGCQNLVIDVRKVELETSILIPRGPIAKEIYLLPNGTIMSGNFQGRTLSRFGPGGAANLS